MIRYVESLNQSLDRLMSEDSRVFLVGEDLVDPYGGAFKVSRGLSTKYPSQVISTPISEAGFTGLAIGMSLQGLRPIVEIMFGDFSTLICDQLVNHALKFSSMYDGKVKVPVVIRVPMGGRRGYGPTHSQTLETLFLNAPDLKVVAPSIYHDPGQMLFDVTTQSESPVLFVENKISYAQKLKAPSRGSVDGFAFKHLIGFSKSLPTISLTTDPSQPPDITLICYGGMAAIAAEAAMSFFKSDDVNTEVLIPSSVKPLPLIDFAESIKLSGKVVIAEEAPRGWGWGAELSSLIVEEFFSFLECAPVRVGSKETSIPCSTKLEKLVLPQVDDVIGGMLELMES